MSLTPKLYKWASISEWNLAKWLERLAVNAKVATVLGSIPASSDTVESEGRQMKQYWISYIIKEKNQKKSPLEYEGHAVRRSANL
jgi:hypothetical protein